jgi:hypothetical protein
MGCARTLDSAPGLPRHFLPNQQPRGWAQGLRMPHVKVLLAIYVYRCMYMYIYRLPAPLYSINNIKIEVRFGTGSVYCSARRRFPQNLVPCVCKPGGNNKQLQFCVGCGVSNSGRKPASIEDSPWPAPFVGGGRMPPPLWRA